MSDPEVPDDLKAMVGMQIILVIIFLPLSGIIVARLFGVPSWYGLVAGGWGLVALLGWQIRKTVKRHIDREVER